MITRNNNNNNNDNNRRIVYPKQHNFFRLPLYIPLKEKKLTIKLIDKR